MTIHTTEHYSETQHHPMRSVTEAARDRKVCALIMTGRGVEEVAQAFDITIHKVASILNEYQHDPAIRNLQGNFAAFNRSKALELVHSKTAAKAPRATPRKSGTTSLKVGNEDIFEALRKAMSACASGDDLSQLEYNEWRAANDPDAPGTRTIRRRMGWQQAKEQAIASRGNQEGLVHYANPAIVGA